MLQRQASTNDELRRNDLDVICHWPLLLLITHTCLPSFNKIPSTKGLNSYHFILAYCVQYIYLVQPQYTCCMHAVSTWLV